MTITQTVNVPDNRVISLKVPPQIPTGQTNVIIQFPVKETLSREELLMKLPPEKRMTEAEEIELINRHADELNRETLDALSYQVALW
ncbi:MAG: hypothetical protein LBU66_05425 [Treponema sp.]|jgi:hypothetical protein|nr:hypothetical protein [Treponema sp.]